MPQANLVREYRLLAGLTQRQLGDAVGLTQSDISKVEKPGFEIYAGWKKRLAEFFGVDRSILFPK